MTLIRTGLLNAVAVCVRMLTLLGINKILAVYVGPTGYAALGQFQNAVQMISTVASGAITNGVTKYTAEYQNDQAKQIVLWQTAGSITIICSVVISGLVFVFRTQLASLVLGDSVYELAFAWLALNLMLVVVNGLLLSVFNGKKDIHRYVVAHVGGSLLALLVTTPLVFHKGLMGAMIGITTYQAMAAMVTLALSFNAGWFRWGDFFGPIDLEVARKLASFTAMALTSAAVTPLSLMAIRNHMAQALGWTAVGYWEALWRLSGAYLMVVTTTLSVYYLPKLSELQTGQALRAEITKGIKVLLPLTLIIAALVYYSRHTLIEILFATEFMPLEELLPWQLVGDIFKMVSWIFAFLLLSKSRTKTFIATELIFSLSFVGLAMAWVSVDGLRGVTLAYALNYLMYLIATGIIALRITNEKM